MDTLCERHVSIRFEDERTTKVLKKVRNAIHFTYFCFRHNPKNRSQPNSFFNL